MSMFYELINRNKRLGATTGRERGNGTAAGFTIIESLVAIVVVTLLMTAITPMLALAVAIRVQARRVEVANQAASTYINGVRSGAIEAPTIIDTDPEVAANTPAPDSGGASWTCATQNYCPSPQTVKSVYCIDGDGDGLCTLNSIADMAVQGIGHNPTAGATADNGYKLIVRVYRADAFGGNFIREGEQSTITSGLGSRAAPVVQLATEIVNENTSFQDLCDRLGGC